MMILGAAFAAMAMQADPGPPPAVRTIQAQMQRSCRALGGRPDFVPDFIAGGDLNRDGRRDYFLNAQGFRCERRGQNQSRITPDHPYCTADQCTNWLVLSAPGVGYRLAWRGMGFNAMPMDNVVHMQARANCRGRGCDLRLRWNGRTLIPAR
jgi:hypothetical protein